MFTGIITAVAPVVSLETRPAGAVLTIQRPAEWDDVATGESVAVSGVCLTVLPGGDGRVLRFDASPETLSRSTLGGLAPGARVNLERSLAVGDRLGGHVVAGHVDATTEVIAVVPSGDFSTFTFVLAPSFSRYVVEKGSIALDGISMTVASLGVDRFDVAVVPHTLAVTALGDRKPGDSVNVEVDVLGKYVERILAARLDADQGARDARLRDLLLERP